MADGNTSLHIDM